MFAQSKFWVRVQENVLTGCWEWIGCKTPGGYGRVRISGEEHLVHRFAYTQMVGPIPPNKELDHVCHNPSCVNPEHLRLADHAQNSRNQLIRKGNKSGFKGVCWAKREGKWHAQITFQGKKYSLGYFNNPEEAYKAYCEAADHLHGEFANYGFKGLPVPEEQVQAPRKAPRPTVDTPPCKSNALDAENGSQL